MKIIKRYGTNNISINEEDIEQEYLEFTSDMDNFNKCRSLIQTYIENEMLFHDIIDCLDSFKTLPIPTSYDCAYHQLRKVINAYLSNSQSFLSAIDKKIGKANFKKITNQVYDEYAEYQFCYELRNVLQHSGFTINVTIENNRYIRIYINKKDFWGINVKDKIITLLNSYPEQIDLIKELNGFHKAQCEILQKGYLGLYNSDAHKRLIDFHTRNTDIRFLYIGDYQSATNDEGLETIKLNFLHFDREKILENIKFYKDRI